MYRLTGPGVKPPAYTAARRPPVDNLDGRARKRRRATSDPNCHAHDWSRRVQVPEPAPPPTLVHDPEFWFEDGSVVLVSLNTGFRVYKRLLVEHSPFFRDLFQMPQPENAPTVEGTPCVVVSDPPEQVRHLLRVLFPTNGHLTYVNLRYNFADCDISDAGFPSARNRTRWTQSPRSSASPTSTRSTAS